MLKEQTNMSAKEIAEYTKDHVWHHAPDGKSLELVPADVHGGVGHTGGSAVIEASKPLAQVNKVINSVMGILFPNTAEKGADGLKDDLVDHVTQPIPMPAADIGEAHKEMDKGIGEGLGRIMGIRPRSRDKDE